MGAETWHNTALCPPIVNPVTEPIVANVPPPIATGNIADVGQIHERERGSKQMPAL